MAKGARETVLFGAERDERADFSVLPFCFSLHQSSLVRWISERFSRRSSLTSTRTSRSSRRTLISFGRTVSSTTLQLFVVSPLPSLPSGSPLVASSLSFSSRLRRLTSCSVLAFYCVDPSHPKPSDPNETESRSSPRVPRRRGCFSRRPSRFSRHGKGRGGQRRRTDGYEGSGWIEAGCWRVG